MSEPHALLLTDVVASARLTEQLAEDGAAELWASHDRVARDLLRHWRGREIDKADGFLLLFGRVEDALGFARAYHGALSALSTPMQARAGLHVGSVTMRTNSAEDIAQGAKAVEIEGVAKVIAARVMALAAGGQTLLTASARMLLGETKTRTRSHGHWRLAGLTEPFELFEAVDTGSSFKDLSDGAKGYRVIRHRDIWLPRREVQHSLPAERDVFVGRESALEDLLEKFEGGARLVSVLGAGGTGKTRLAQRFGWRSLGEFPGGVWFCDLAQARSLEGIARAVASAFNVPLGTLDPVSQLGNAIYGRGRCLVILDNFEQVSRLADSTIGRWLDRAADASFIVTSREVLGIAGEHTLALPPLSDAEGTTLFRRRAAAARNGFAPGADDEAAIAPLVKLLDGLPLAIELAAARVRVMSPRTLLERMSERFTLLASRGGRLDRQATLRGAIDWSWELLTRAEQTALAQLSVFEGGFSLPAAEAVLDLSGTSDAFSAANLVQSLVDKSLVRQLADHRFGLLVSIQEYAAERLVGLDPASSSAGIVKTHAELRHCAYFVARQAEREAISVVEDLDNLVTACRRAAARGDATSATALLERAWVALKDRGPYATAIQLAATIRDIGGIAERTAAHLYWISGAALLALGRTVEAEKHLRAGLDVVAGTGDERLEAGLRCSLGDHYAKVGSLDEAYSFYEMALVLSHSLKDAVLQCAVLNGLASCHESRGELDEAATSYEAALACARVAGDRRWEGGTLGNLGQLSAIRGRHQDAKRLYDEAIAIARALGDRRWEGNSLCNLSQTSQALGKLHDARAQLQAALGIARDLGQRRLEAITLCNIGLADEAMTEPDSARRAYKEAIEVAHELRDVRSEGQFRTYLGLLEGRSGNHQQARQDLAAAESLLESVSDRLSLGLALASLAEVEHLACDIDAARQALIRAEKLAETLRPEPQSELGLALARVRELVH